MNKEKICIAGVATTVIGITGILLKDNKYISNYKKILLFISSILTLFGSAITLAALDSLLKPIEEDENVEELSQ